MVEVNPAHFVGQLGLTSWLLESPSFPRFDSYLWCWCKSEVSWRNFIYLNETLCSKVWNLFYKLLLPILLTLFLPKNFRFRLWYNLIAFLILCYLVFHIYFFFYDYSFISMNVCLFNFHLIYMQSVICVASRYMLSIVAMLISRFLFIPNAKIFSVIFAAQIYFSNRTHRQLSLLSQSMICFYCFHIIFHYFLYIEDFH